MGIKPGRGEREKHREDEEDADSLLQLWLHIKAVKQRRCEEEEGGKIL